MQKYNTQLPKIKLPEYGRNLQELVQYCKTIPDREKRTAYAYTIIEVMADLYSEIAKVDEGKRILWDHLALISNFELDIDFPYPVIPKEDLMTAPTSLKRNEEGIRFKMYGKVVEQMVQQAKKLESSEQRIQLFELCANHMKRNFHFVNKEADEDNAKIKNDLIGYAGKEFAEEIMQIKLKSVSDLQKNEQYDPSKLVETKKKKKKKK